MSTQVTASNAPGVATFQAMFPGTSQQVTVGASSTQAGTAFAKTTSLVRFFSTVDCFIAFNNGTAVADGTNFFLPGGITESLGVQGGTKIAVIQKTTGGTLYMTEAA